MNWNYKYFVENKLNRLNTTLGLGLNIIVANDQAFDSPEFIAEDTIYVVIKYLSGGLTLGFETLPVQMLVLTESSGEIQRENNGFTKAKKLMEAFVRENTETQTIESTTFIKHNYTMPQNITNFLMVGNTYRNILYVSGTLLVMENVLDLTELTIDGADFEALNFSIGYQMQPNTQPVGGNLCESVKSTASLTLSFSIPFKSGTFATKVLGIASGTNSGNQNFSINFKLGTSNFFTNATNFKLTTASISTSKNTMPTLQVGFIK